MDAITAKQIVERGYDRIAEQYLAAKDAAEEPATLSALEELTRGLPPGDAVLDLGCGAGVPATRWLSERFAVTGVDISARQLELARRHAPAATLIQGDMSTLDLPDSTFGAVAAFYAIIHLPRAEQPALLRRIHRWLRPGGRFLATWALYAWEGDDRDWQGWGAPMWWSHHDAETSRWLLQEAGLQIASAAVRSHGGETWLWVLAEKPDVTIP